MSSFTPDQQAELVRIIERRETVGVNRTLIRQLQSSAFTAADGTGDRYASGLAGPITVGGGGLITIPHGLVDKDGAAITPTGAFGFALGWGGYLNAQAPDATNIYLNPSIALVANYLYWLAIG